MRGLLGRWRQLDREVHRELFGGEKRECGTLSPHSQASVASVINDLGEEHGQKEKRFDRPASGG